MVTHVTAVVFFIITLKMAGFLAETCWWTFILVVPCIVNLFYVSNQQDAVLSSLFCTAKSLYMFRVPFAPIIRST